MDNPGPLGISVIRDYLISLIEGVEGKMAPINNKSLLVFPTGATDCKHATLLT